MRRVLLAVAIAAVVCGCKESGDGVAARNQAATPKSVTAVATPRPVAVSSVGGFADRGQLFTYSDAAPVSRGASTRHEIQMSEANALRSVAEGAMTIQAPDGHPIRLEHARAIEHADGNWSFVGSPEHAQPGQQAVITFGEKAVFGLIPNRDGEPLEITTIGGRTYLVETDGSKLPAPAASLANDTIAAVMANDAVVPAASAPTSKRIASAAASRVQSASLVASKALSQTNTVDVLLGYTPTFTARFGGTSQAVTRLNAMIDIANSALDASQVDAQFRLVGTLEVNVADNTSNRATLLQLTGVTCTTGGPTGLPDGGVTCSPAARPAALQALADQREVVGADVVGLVRTFQSPENVTCGVGWVSGAAQTPINADDAPFGYLVVSDTNGNMFPDPDDGATCRSDNLAHELGHVLGLQHDRASAANNDGDGVLDPEEFGALPYAFGYVAGAAVGNFYDTMALRQNNVPGRVIYSNPQVMCNGFPCGIADQADAARALRQTIPMIAAFRSTIVPLPGKRNNDFDGDGRSDILWRNTSTGQNQMWMAASSASTVALNTVGTAWRVAGTGDFNGDGKSDILWRNSTTGANTIYLSANSATQQAVATVANQAWTVAGAGDFNGDGKSDILWRNTTTGANTIWLSGSNLTQQAVGTVGNQAWRVQGVGDFNGDGFADILWRNNSTGGNLIWRSANIATQQPINPVSNQQWLIVGVADFDADGQSDILWRNTVTGANTIWRSGNNLTQIAVSPVGNQAWHVVRTGDYDGDGKGDILWRNSSTGANLLWRSGSSATQTPVTTVANQAWTIAG
jgi:hypothetical protein